MHPAIPTLMTLFAGDKDAHGVYKLTGNITQGGKMEGKAFTIKKPVTMELWDDHLAGKQGLGIIPINTASLVKFGVIDIDEYSLDLINLTKKVYATKLPLVVIRSKSGGAHIYMFLSEFCPAAKVQTKMREIASMFGYGTCEIYPKQVRILVERGDIGQWINMPYFDSTKTTRYAYNKELKALSLDEFMKFASDRMITPQQLDELKIELGDELRDGPPCLQHLILQGFPKGTRNNGLFNLGVYARKVNPDAWKTLVEQFNQKYMDPPLSPNEVLGVIKSLSNKEYNYTCGTEPVHQHCNAQICRARKHGIGTGSGMPSMGTLTKLATEPPIWFIDIEDGGRMELTTDDLQFPIKFQKRCMDAMNIMPSVVKRDVWEAIVQKLMENISVIEMPADSSPFGRLLEIIESFCTGRVQGKVCDDLLLGKPWTNNGRHYFRMRDLISHLERLKFTEFKSNRVAYVLKEILKGTHHFFNVKGKGVNCWSIPEFKVQTEGFDVPDQSKDEVF